MMWFLFALIVLLIGVIWFGHRKFAMILFIIWLVLMIIWFKHHATDALHLTW